jgi:hypothetical protein
VRLKATISRKNKFIAHTHKTVSSLILTALTDRPGIIDRKALDGFRVKATCERATRLRRQRDSDVASIAGGSAPAETPSGEIMVLVLVVRFEQLISIVRLEKLCR